MAVPGRHPCGACDATTTRTGGTGHVTAETKAAAESVPAVRAEVMWLKEQTVRTIATIVGALAVCVPVLGADAPPTFTKKPTATKDGDTVRVSFAVDRTTDVAVYVENAKGEIVRHLVAGVLGKNAPVPFSPDSLAQEIEWDGKDDIGRPADGGPFRIRVGLGLRAAYAGQAFAEAGQTGPNKIENVLGLASGPEGRLYVLDGRSGNYWGPASMVLVFRRNGAYERAIKPFPSNLPVERARAAGVFTNSLGGFNPLSHRIRGLAFYPAEEIAHQPAVTADGRVVLAVKGARLAMLDADGGIPGEAYAGPALGEGLGYATYPFLVAAPDGKRVYLSGLVPGKSKTAHAVYTARLPDRGPAEAWFGEPGKPGNDKSHLSDVRGLAVDGKGHLLVADRGNNRVLVLSETDGSVAGSFPVQAPNWLAVGARTGAVYVQSGNTVIKFSGWKNAREVARLDLRPPGRKKSWKLALDASAAPAVLWAACGANLVRSEDQGATFSDPAPAGCFAAQFYWRPAADPTRREVLCKIGGTAGYGARLDILDEATGTIRSFGKRAVAGMEGRNHRLGPDGAIYAQDHAFRSGGVIRFDRDGKVKPFEATLTDPHLKGRLPVGHTGTTMWERDFSVDRKGDIYVKARGPEYHGLMTVHVYDQRGAFKRIALQTVSDGMYGPRVDPAGNLYIMEAVKTPGRLFPEELADSLRAFPSARDGYDWIYGSIIKFSPEGGAVWFSGRQASPLTYEGWGSGTSVSDLRTADGALTGTIAKKPAMLSFPSVRLDAAAQTRITMRLKNDSDGAQATFRYHNLDEGYIEACGPGKSKTIDVKPNSDFTEYTFDLAGEPHWKGPIWNMTLVPTTATKGTFSLDWVRVGDAASGLVWNFDAEDGPDKKLPATLKREKVGAYARPGGAVLQGALWWRPGFSPVGDMGVGRGGCHCTGSDFDVDDFGRVFAPDTGRFRVGVLDTNGNEILSFGGYGNQDCCGPDSYVLDPKGAFFRPRRAGDPKALVSPFAKPDIAFAWIIGLAVTDKYAYISDVINKRILRVKLGYAADAACAIP